MRVMSHSFFNTAGQKGFVDVAGLLLRCSFCSCSMPPQVLQAPMPHPKAPWRSPRPSLLLLISLICRQEMQGEIAAAKAQQQIVSDNLAARIDQVRPWARLLGKGGAGLRHSARVAAPQLAFTPTHPHAMQSEERGRGAEARLAAADERLASISEQVGGAGAGELVPVLVQIIKQRKGLLKRQLLDCLPLGILFMWLMHCLRVCTRLTRPQVVQAEARLRELDERSKAAAESASGAINMDQVGLEAWWW